MTPFTLTKAPILYLPKVSWRQRAGENVLRKRHCSAQSRHLRADGAFKRKGTG
ncbi:hypothetical protein C8R44DRAFT_762952 [Mycena epipterygia]|nr:hypothetical protein C8R44DRAFT_762952 [Mycena epipterygia]